MFCTAIIETSITRYSGQIVIMCCQNIHLIECQRILSNLKEILRKLAPIKKQSNSEHPHVQKPEKNHNEKDNSARYIPQEETRELKKS